MHTSLPQPKPHRGPAPVSLNKASVHTRFATQGSVDMDARHGPTGSRSHAAVLGPGLTSPLAEVDSVDELTQMLNATSLGRPKQGDSDSDGSACGGQESTEEVDMALSSILTLNSMLSSSKCESSGSRVGAARGLNCTSGQMAKCSLISQPA